MVRNHSIAAKNAIDVAVFMTIYALARAFISGARIAGKTVAHCAPLAQGLAFLCADPYYPQ